MATQIETRQRPLGKEDRPLRAIGNVLLVVGLLGIVAWGVVAGFSASYGSMSQDSIAFHFAEIGIEDPVNRPDVWSAKDVSGEVIWEGTEAELELLTEQAQVAYQAELRSTWLYPAVAVTAVGVMIALFERRRRSEGPIPK